ncbi:MAG: hypothetical protein VB050_04910 [Geobacteraceae bacterium]|nr:hypothetical protein [Geobacteraceae bacterium]
MLTDKGADLLWVMVEDYKEKKKTGDAGNLTIMEMLEDHGLADGTSVPETLDADQTATLLEQILPPEVQDRINEVAERLQGIPEDQWGMETNLQELLS